MNMAEYLATLAAGCWTGAALYIAIAEHPSALRVGVRFATEYFRPMSKRTAPLMMILSGVGGIAGLYAWWNNGVSGWLIGGVLLLAMFPLTGILIVPTNLKLLKVDALNNPEEAELLHARWGKMHWLRTIVGAPAFLIFAWYLTGS
jgi:hypothetical protein